MVPLSRGRVREGTIALAQLLPRFQALPPLPVSDWHPFSCCPGAGSPSEWVCVCSRAPWGSLNGLSWETAFSSVTLTPTGFYSQRLWGFFPSTRTLGCMVWPGAGITHSPVVPPCFYPPHMNMGPATTASLCVLSTRLPMSAPSTRPDECFFFNSLVVGLL